MKRNMMALGGLLFGLVMFTGGYVSAQDKQENIGRRFAANYVKSADDTRLTQEAMEILINRYEKNHAAATNAMQEVQASSEVTYQAQMVQIAQNKRIIELLEQIAAKR